jgi:hypothetical protein
VLAESDLEDKRIGFRRMSQANRNITADQFRAPATQSRAAGHCRLLFGLFALLLMLASTGCVQRRMLIRSQPEGAMVTIDRQAIGQTPVSVPFTYYGTREIQLEKDGYQTIQVRQRMRPPWYEVFPISFFSNHFAMREVKDVRRLDFELIPKVQVSEYQLIERANQLRTDVERGTVTAPIGK